MKKTASPARVAFLELKMPEGLGRPEGKPDGKGKGKDGGKPDYAYGKTDLAKGKVRDYPGKGTPAASPPARTVEGLPSRPPLPGGLPAIGARPTRLPRH